MPVPKPRFNPPSPSGSIPTAPPKLDPPTPPGSPTTTPSGSPTTSPPGSPGSSQPGSPITSPPGSPQPGGGGGSKLDKMTEMFLPAAIAGGTSGGVPGANTAAAAAGVAEGKAEAIKNSAESKLVNNFADADTGYKSYSGFGEESALLDDVVKSSLNEFHKNRDTALAVTRQQGAHTRAIMVGKGLMSMAKETVELAFKAAADIKDLMTKAKDSF